MNFKAILFFCATLSTTFVWGWQQPETEEYSDDSLPVGSNSWKEGNEEKRNTWWTKKSFPEEQLTSNCYTGRCMAMFQQCLRQAENSSIYLQCKESELFCIARCLRESKEKFSMNSMAMSS